MFTFVCKMFNTYEQENALKRCDENGVSKGYWI